VGDLSAADVTFVDGELTALPFRAIAGWHFRRAG